MSKKEEFQKLIEQLESIGDELNSLLEDDREENEDIDQAMFSLRMSIDEVSELEIED